MHNFCEEYEKQLVPVLAKNNISHHRVLDSHLVEDFQSAVARALSLPLEHVENVYEQFKSEYAIGDEPMCSYISHWFIEYLDPTYGVVQFMIDTDCKTSTNYILSNELDLVCVTNVNLDRHKKVVCFVCSYYKNPGMNNTWRPDVLLVNDMQVIPINQVEETFSKIGFNTNIWKCPELMVRKVYSTKNNTSIYPEIQDVPYTEGILMREFRRTR